MILSLLVLSSFPLLRYTVAVRGQNRLGEGEETPHTSFDTLQEGWRGGGGRSEERSEDMKE